MQLLISEASDLTEPQARIITQAVQAIANDPARIDHLRQGPHLNDTLISLGKSLLALPRSRPVRKTPAEAPH
ncbi:hypothetical protein [Actinomadura sp. SCN-SB]|uniref:hypothetical protein n=1 Tax=Actinomadura sp. SCN-SB TaxID=3373092 RepID=UPI0037524B20